VLGTLHAAMDAGDLVAPTMQQPDMGSFGGEEAPEMGEMPPEAPEMGEMSMEAPEMPPEGMME